MPLLSWPPSCFPAKERAAKECSVSERTFADWRAAGKVRFYKVGRRVLIKPSELQEDLTKFRRQRMPKRRMRRLNGRLESGS